MYEVIGAPPSDAGVDHETDALRLPPTADTFVGASGARTVAKGVTGALGAEGSLSRTVLRDFTVKVYGVPGVRWVTVHLSAVVVVQVCESGDEVTVYPEVGVPAVGATAAHLTSADRLPAVAVGAKGVAGGRRNLIEAVGADIGPLPVALVALTENM